MQVPINDVKEEVLAAIYRYYPKKIHSWFSHGYPDGAGLKPLLERIHQTHQHLDWTTFVGELEEIPERRVKHYAIPPQVMESNGYVEVRLTCEISIREPVEQFWYSLYFFVSAVVPYYAYYIESRRDYGLKRDFSVPVPEEVKNFLMQFAQLRRDHRVTDSFIVNAQLKQNLIEMRQALQTYGHAYGISVEDWDRSLLFQHQQYLAEHYQDYQPTRHWTSCPAVFQDTLATVLACQQLVIGYRAFPVALLGEVVPGISTRFKQDGEVTMGDLIFNFDPLSL
ncbi:MAG: hypothetical protein H7Z75_04475 [Ferruginibacter sp.]|nr:hypothetical protein [Cytophagales bacterium]